MKLNDAYKKMDTGDIKSSEKVTSTNNKNNTNQTTTSTWSESPDNLKAQYQLTQTIKNNNTKMMLDATQVSPQKSSAASSQPAVVTSESVTSTLSKSVNQQVESPINTSRNIVLNILKSVPLGDKLIQTIAKSIIQDAFNRGDTIPTLLGQNKRTQKNATSKGHTDEDTSLATNTKKILQANQSKLDNTTQINKQQPLKDLLTAGSKEENTPQLKQDTKRIESNNIKQPTMPLSKVLSASEINIGANTNTELNTGVNKVKLQTQSMGDSSIENQTQVIKPKNTNITSQYSPKKENTTIESGNFLNEKITKAELLTLLEKITKLPITRSSIEKVQLVQTLLSAETTSPDNSTKQTIQAQPTEKKLTQQTQVKSNIPNNDTVDIAATKVPKDKIEISKNHPIPKHNIDVLLKTLFDDVLMQTDQNRSIAPTISRSQSVIQDIGALVTHVNRQQQSQLNEQAKPPQAETQQIPLRNIQESSPAIAPKKTANVSVEPIVPSQLTHTPTPALDEIFGLRRENILSIAFNLLTNNKTQGVEQESLASLMQHIPLPTTSTQHIQHWLKTRPDNKALAKVLEQVQQGQFQDMSLASDSIKDDSKAMIRILAEQRVGELRQNSDSNISYTLPNPHNPDKPIQLSIKRDASKNSENEAHRERWNISLNFNLGEKGILRIQALWEQKTLSLNIKANSHSLLSRAKTHIGIVEKHLTSLGIKQKSTNFQLLPVNASTGKNQTDEAGLHIQI